LLEQGFINKVPVLLGVNKNDGGIVPLSEIAENLGQEISPKLFTSLVMMRNQRRTKGETKLMKQAILKQYTNHSAPDLPPNIKKQWIDLLIDSWFNAPAVQMARALAKSGMPVYVYQFRILVAFSAYPEILGVNHGDEVLYVFGWAWTSDQDIHKVASTYTGVERSVSAVMLKSWLGFATFG